MLKREREAANKAFDEWREIEEMKAVVQAGLGDVRSLPLPPG